MPWNVGQTHLGVHMASLIEQLTEAKIRAIADCGLHADGRGLYLQIRPGGSRSWIFRFTLDRRTRYKGLGAFSEVSLVEARAMAAACRALLAKQIDPIEHAKAVRETKKIVVAPSPGPTFEEAAESYMVEKLRRLRSEVHRRQWHYSLEKFAYRSSVRWQSRTLARRTFSPCCGPFGRIDAKQPRACGEGSNGYSHAQLWKAIAQAPTLQHGGDTCKKLCRHAQRWRR